MMWKNNYFSFFCRTNGEIQEELDDNQSYDEDDDDDDDDDDEDDADDGDDDDEEEEEESGEKEKKKRKLLPLSALKVHTVFYWLINSEVLNWLNLLLVGSLGFDTFARLQIRVCIGKLFSLFLSKKICCGYSKEPSQWAPKTHV